MKQKPLSKAQQELLTAMMNNGVRVIFMSGLDAYAFRTDTHRRCTTIVEALVKRGLVERYGEDWRGFEYRVGKEGGAT